MSNNYRNFKRKRRGTLYFFNATFLQVVTSTFGALALSVVAECKAIRIHVTTEDDYLVIETFVLNIYISSFITFTVMIIPRSLIVHFSSSNSLQTRVFLLPWRYGNIWGLKYYFVFNFDFSLTRINLSPLTCRLHSGSRWVVWTN